MGRYDRNGIFSTEDMKQIRAAHVCVIGSGGLGGYIIEMLARVGIGEITVVDGDIFDETNLNRQLFSTSENLGGIKVFEAKKRIAQVNPETIIHAIHALLDEENAVSMLQRADLVVDALDNVPARLAAQVACEELQIPLIHGAIAGWYGQVTTILPGDRTLDRLYKNPQEKGIEQELGNPSFTPAMIASIQVSETLKVLLGKEEILRNRILMIDLLDNEFQIFTI